MRHYKKGRKLGTDASHTKAMKRSLVKSLFLNDRIKTIESRAKEIRPDVDKIVTWAKKGDLHSRRLAIAALGNDKELVREIFEKVAQGMFADRQGGYTRIMKLGPRKGDNAPMVIMELVTEPVQKKTAEAPAEKAEPKKVEAPAEEAKAEEVVEEAAEAAEAPAEEAEEKKAE
ncbi:50S ribosomal protein L17 [Slackia piriformis]